MKKMPRFAVILSGSGRADGSEIHESVSAMLAIDKQGCVYQCFAPNIKQAAVINGLTSTPMNETRNVLIESARIARGNIKDIKELNLKDYDCIVFPGGLGAITNWCDFKTAGVACTVETSINKLLEKAYKQNKVIGAMCIAPVVIAKVLGKYGITVTIGDDIKTAEIIEKTGAVHKTASATAVVVDEKNKIVTTPAYMLSTTIKEVLEGAENMVKAMISLSKKS